MTPRLTQIDSNHSGRATDFERAETIGVGDECPHEVGRIGDIAVVGVVVDFR